MTKNLKIGLVILACAVAFLIWDMDLLSTKNDDVVQEVPPPTTLSATEYKTVSAKSEPPIKLSNDALQLHELQLNLLKSQYLAKTAQNASDARLAELAVEKAAQELVNEEKRLASELKMSENAHSPYGGPLNSQLAQPSDGLPKVANHNRVSLNTILDSNAVIITVNDEASVVRKGGTYNGIRLDAIDMPNNKVSITAESGRQSVLSIEPAGARSFSHVQPLANREEK